MKLADAESHPRWAAARNRLEIHDYARASRILGCSRDEARALRSELLGSHVEVAEDVVEAEGPVIRTLDQLLDAAEVDRAKWRVRRWVTNHWADRWQVKAWLERREDWELEPLPVLDLGANEQRETGDGLTVLALGDAHFGFQRGHDGKLEPIHDERALARALATAREVEPDRIVILGDMLDLSAWSTKYHGGAGAYGTTRPALEALRAFLAELAAIAPLTYIEGNHEARVAKALRERLPEAEGLLTIPGLLAVEGLDYRGPYPSGEVWIDGVLYHHGEVVRATGGATVAAEVAKATASQVHGHIHRRELASRTIHGEDGAREIWAYSPGCLCRVDGAVPGSTRPDWQQGVAVVRSGCLST